MSRVLKDFLKKQIGCVDTHHVPEITQLLCAMFKKNLIFDECLDNDKYIIMLVSFLCVNSGFLQGFSFFLFLCPSQRPIISYSSLLCHNKRHTDAPH